MLVRFFSLRSITHHEIVANISGVNHITIKKWLPASA